MLPSLKTWIQPLYPTWKKERTDYCKLSDLYLNASPPSPHTHLDGVQQGWDLKGVIYLYSDSSSGITRGSFAASSSIGLCKKDILPRELQGLRGWALGVGEKSHLQFCARRSRGLPYSIHTYMGCISTGPYFTERID